MKHLIEQKIVNAFNTLGIDTSLAKVNKSEYADFQCNGLLRFQNGIDLANKIADILSADTFFADVTAQGRGFLNFTISDAVILENVRNPPSNPIKQEKIFIDFGGPNISKPLHVGHMRSANIGEALKRIATELGHTVIGDIHLGDWGTPMGMLLVAIQTQFTLPELTSDYLNTLYPVVSKLFKTDDIFAAAARLATVNLQKNGVGRDIWEKIREISIQDFKKDFDELNVSFDIWNGESDAHQYVENVLEATKNIAYENEGALIVDVPDSPPLMLQNSADGYTYAATDLATIYMRQSETPTIIMYVVDNRHSLHFKQLFHVAKKANITTANLEHISFGTINGTDGKPYKTRDGGVMRLREFIDQAYSMAAKEAGYDIDNVDAETSKMIFDIGLGAIKFADLCNPRTSDYIFSPDSVKFIGKTGPYIQYTYVRCKSILKCYDEISETSEIFSEIKTFSHPTERALCMALINFNEDLQSAFEKRMPHILCDYVYTLCQKFSSFYAECPVLGENDPDIKSFRLFLVHKTSVTIKKVLDCLAIPAPEKMTRA